ncbi:MAG TPA: sugar phosphate isomerase/epimerase family protein [Planctomycetota bacterium]|nr:sugar phosphate isomerase/epimerase family protein [Planctomycetota bacterium]
MLTKKLSLTLNVGFFSDLAATRRVAEERGLGIEIQHFADGALLDGAWREKVSEIKNAFKNFSGVLSMHGPYDNLDPAAWDPQVQAVSRGRYLHAMQIADQIGARIIVFHNWYFPTLRYHHGLPRWLDRRIPVWQDLARSAEKFGVTLVLENVWEPDPAPQIALIDAVNSPFVRACLDTGHANMTALNPAVHDGTKQPGWGVGDWIDQLGERLVYVHAHNNSGAHDDHWAFGKGTLDIAPVLRKLAAMKCPPRVCLELRNFEDQLSSLKLIDEVL